MTEVSTQRATQDMNDCCCVCKLPFGGSTRRKRKLLYNSACEEARRYLNEVLLQKLQLSLNSFVETRDSRVYLCHLCSSKATTYFRLHKELRETEEYVVSKFSHLTRISEASISAQPQNRSRLSNSSSNARKRLRIALDSDDTQEDAEAAARSGIESQITSTTPSRLQEGQEVARVTPSRVQEGQEVARVTPSRVQGREISEAILTSPSTPSLKNNRIVPEVTVLVNYITYTKKFNIHTPSRQDAIKNMCRREYQCAIGNLHKQATPQDSAIPLVKVIVEEIKQLCSLQQRSVFRDTDQQCIRNFKWEHLWHELASTAPTLLTFYKQLFTGAPKPLICFAISMAIKWRSPKMGLVQRVISTVMYGNGASKQLYNCLQPLMVCLSYNGMNKNMKSLATKFDSDVLKWSAKLADSVEGCIGRQTVKVSWAGPTIADEEENSDNEEEFRDNDRHNDVIETDGSFEGDGNDGDEIDMAEDQNMEMEDNFNIDVDPVQVDIFPPLDENVGCWNGFKIVGDNVDKNLRRSFQRCDRTTVSLHYFHVCAVRDRVDFSSLSNIRPTDVLIDPITFLPNTADLNSIKEEFQILVSRILVQHLPQLSGSTGSIKWHIPSQYTNEMSAQSRIVPLGVQLFNENKTDEMCAIMKALQSYVPKKSYNVTYHLSEEFIAQEDCYHPILFGGDQLTACRARGAQLARFNDDTSEERCDGLLPVVEDWHARMTLMRVIWSEMFFKKSSAEKGTLYQLKNVLHRSSVPNDPGENMKAAEDFLFVVLHGHVVAAAETILSSAEGRNIDVTALSEKIVNSYVQLAIPSPNAQFSQTTDKVSLYAMQLLTLSLLWSNFHDAIKEGDGDRIIRSWKFNLLAFKAANRNNYSKEALNLILQVNHLFSPREAAQVKWSRTVNTTNRQGHNILMDLHVEHLNRRLKTTLRNMGSNVTDNAVRLAAESVDVVDHVCHTFEKASITTKSNSDKHTSPSFEKDLKLILSVLQDQDVFRPKESRNHETFKNLKLIFDTLKYKDLLKWIKSTTKSLTD